MRLSSTGGAGSTRRTRESRRRDTRARAVVERRRTSSRVGAQEVRLERRTRAAGRPSRRASSSSASASTHRSAARVERERIGAARRQRTTPQRRHETRATTRRSEHARASRLERRARVPAHAADRSTRPRIIDAVSVPARTQGARARVGALLRRSPSATRGPRRPTRSGRAIVELLTAAGHDVAGTRIVKDDADRGARADRSGSSPAPTCRRSSRPAAPASRRATARSRRSTALLEKRLDGFGELFRMLSYQEIGPAAMMSRACAGLVGRTRRRLAAGIGSGGAAGDDEADPSRARTSRAASEHERLAAMTDAPVHATRSPLEEARALTRRRRVAPIDRTERVRARRRATDAWSRADVASTIDVPPFVAPAMDGYAVDRRGHVRRQPRRAADACACIDRIYTGQVSTRRSTPATCIEIATGAPLPDGADAVVMVEETETAAATTVRDLRRRSIRGQHVGRRGADIVAGQTRARARATC